MTVLCSYCNFLGQGKPFGRMKISEALTKLTIIIDYNSKKQTLNMLYSFIILIIIKKLLKQYAAYLG